MALTTMTMDMNMDLAETTFLDLGLVDPTPVALTTMATDMNVDLSRTLMVQNFCLDLNLVDPTSVALRIWI